MVQKSPGFLRELQKQLEGLSEDDLRRASQRGGLEISTLLENITNPIDHNIQGAEEPDPSKITDYSCLTETDEVVGHNAIAAGKVAFVVMAGGAGTRAGSSKGLLRLSSRNDTLLGHKLSLLSSMPHVWVMTSPSNHGEIESHVMSHPSGGSRVKLFAQFESLRLTPDNLLYMTDGRPSFYPCGHGDLIPSLQQSGILTDFLKRGGEHIVVTNVDNVLFSVSDRIVGRHLLSKSPITCEVVSRTQDESGGLLCKYAGVDQIVETFRFFDGDTPHLKWLNTNTFTLRADLDFSTVDWAWHRVKKNLNNCVVVQYERLIQDLTSAFETRFIAVPRNLRFFPVKSASDVLHADRMLSM